MIEKQNRINALKFFVKLVSNYECWNDFKGESAIIFEGKGRRHPVLTETIASWGPWRKVRDKKGKEDSITELLR